MILSHVTAAKPRKTSVKVVMGILSISFRQQHQQIFVIVAQYAL
jgi:hypothetical protein